MSKLHDRLSCAAIDAQSVDFDWSEGLGENWQIVYPSTDKMTAEECLEKLDEMGIDVPYSYTDALRDICNEVSRDWNSKQIVAFLKTHICIPSSQTDDAPRRLVRSVIDEFTVKQLQEFVSQYKLELDESNFIDDLREAVQQNMSGDDQYAPMMNYYYPLPDFEMDAADAQAILDKSSCACVVVEVKESGDDYPETVVLALAGGGMNLSWDICKSYMLLGYLPPIHFCSLPKFSDKKLTKENKWVLDGCKESVKVITQQACSVLRELKSVEKYLRANSASNKK